MAADCRIPNKAEEGKEYAESMLPPSTDSGRRHEEIAVPFVNVGRFYSEKRPKHIFRETKVTFHSRIVSILVVSVLINIYPVCSLFLDCDSVKSCICGKDNDGGWRIECPNDNRFEYFEYPIELKVQRLDISNFKEASLTIQCNQSNKADPWSYIKGIDLSAKQVYAKIVRLEIRYCPPVEDGWSTLLKKVNLTGEDIVRFSFITEDRSDYAKSVFIPPNFFQNMPNVEILNLRDNTLNAVPDLSSLKNLSSINLRSYNLEIIPAGTFTRNTQLTHIALTKNKISFIAPHTFPISVEHLELNDNQISFLNSSMFSNLNSLKRLYLNNNKLDEIDVDTFNGMSSLEELLLFNSKMTHFPNFFNLSKLANLTISTAIDYKYVPAPGGGEDVTTTLAPDYLPDNQLVLKNLPSLENINVPLNHFKTLPILENLPKLVKIDLHRNEITDIESDVFAELPSLKVLNLSRNQLRKLGAMKAIALEELDVSRNELTELHNYTFRFMSSLKKLNLAKNQIDTVSQKAFEPLAELQELDLSFNQVTFSSSSPYAGMRTADQELYSFFGDLNQSPLRSSFKLRKLKLAHNNIEKLGFSDWTQVFTQINDIDLSFNKIKHVTANELNFISYNLTLNLENNEISTVDMTIAHLLLDSNSGDSNLIRVNLGGNPLNCDCLAYGLKSWKSESYDLRIKDVNCYSPPNLKGIKLNDVSNDNLLCDMDKGSGCSEPCSCKERTVDKTVLIDCSLRNLTFDEMPKLNTFSKKYTKWMLELDLSGNQITDFNNTNYMKEFLNKTRQINLSGNNLTSTMFLERVSDYQPTTFAIANNPFPCTNCIGFQIPWRAYPTRISDLVNVTCQKESSDSASRHPNYDLVYVQENSKEFETHCANASKLAVVVILPLVIAVIFLSCLCISLFVTIRYGWAIKAYLYSKGWDWCLFWERDLDAEEETEGHEKLYDAFISYSHKDEDWVLDELVKRLEGQDGFKLCLHFRDGIPGDWIPDQIVRSVDKSRRTVVVLSKNFVESVWSRLEFKAAHAQALKERSNRVILILLGEDLKETDVQDDDLKMYMKMNTFMKWNDPLFWHRLKYALPHKKPCNSSSPQTVDELKQNALNKMQQRDRAIKLDKLRAKLEQNV